MSRITLPNGRVIETNDEIIRLTDEDDMSFKAALLEMIVTRSMPPIDKDSDEWKEFSEGWDKVRDEVDKEYLANKVKEQNRVVRTKKLIWDSLRYDDRNREYPSHVWDKKEKVWVRKSEFRYVDRRRRWV